MRETTKTTTQYQTPEPMTLFTLLRQPMLAGLVVKEDGYSE